MLTEGYDEKYLNPKDKAFLRGFDWCMERAVDNFFDNGMGMLQEQDSYIGHILNEKLPDCLKDEYNVNFVFADGTEHRVVETYADLIRSKMIDWVQSSRDELITSMIDDMDTDEYREIKERVDGQGETGNGQKA